eukprot:CAMPEP_0178896718 /NCGR_PEP_ID=MMETSP0786-20121207/1338_1 /TAXON_ID=186022 /ORGANISM="Thalassionema frauenfeldii, Strain CCMP 1798" /LENGTH=301 /DNA_ID=CAMNT_0020567171 /DNA_START=3171 /DNA_END=4076 /DNA_ORIENTATION=-
MDNRESKKQSAIELRDEDKDELAGVEASLRQSAREENRKELNEDEGFSLEIESEKDEGDKKPAAVEFTCFSFDGTEEHAIETERHHGEGQEKNLLELPAQELGSAPMAINEDEIDLLDTNSDEGEVQGENLLEPSVEEINQAKNPRQESAIKTFYSRIKDLYKYKEKRGDCDVPQKYEENRKLGIWVNKQRAKRKMERLSDRQVRALDALGFDWGETYGKDLWNNRYGELREYKRIHGNCLVPTKYKDNSKLGRWVSTQRSKLKKGILDREKIDQLNEIGFVWDYNHPGGCFESESTSDPE